MVRKLAAVVLAVVLGVFLPAQMAVAGSPPAAPTLFLTENDSTYRLTIDGDGRTMTLDQLSTTRRSGSDWANVMEMSGWTEGNQFHVMFASPTDTVEIVVDQINGQPDPTSDVMVMVNGVIASAPLDQLQVAPPDDAKEPGIPSEAETLALVVRENLVNFDGFISSATTLGSAMTLIVKNDAGYTSNGFWSCAACAASLAAYGISLAALVLACGGPVGVACVLAFIALTLDKVGVLSSCYSCLN